MFLKDLTLRSSLFSLALRVNCRENRLKNTDSGVLAGLAQEPSVLSLTLQGEELFDKENNAFPGKQYASKHSGASLR